jgi:hypothetical protein
MAIQSPNLGGLLQAFGQLQQSNALVRARKDAAEQRANARRANTLRTIGTIGGAIAGASVAGPGGGVKGAAIGANIGSTAGGMIAGSRGYSQGPSANEVLQSGLQLSEFPTDERQAALKTQQEQAQEDAKLNRDYLIARTKALTPPTPVADQNAPFTTEEKRLAGVGAQLAQSLFGSNPSETQPGPARRLGGPVGGEQFRLKRKQDTQDVQTLNSSLGELKQEFNAIEQSAVGPISKGRVGDTAIATNNMKWLAEQIRNEPTIEGKQLLASRSKGIMTQPLKEFMGLVRPVKEKGNLQRFEGVDEKGDAAAFTFNPETGEAKRLEGVGTKPKEKVKLQRFEGVDEKGDTAAFTFNPETGEAKRLEGVGTKPKEKVKLQRFEGVDEKGDTAAFTFNPETGGTKRLEGVGAKPKGSGKFFNILSSTQPGEDPTIADVKFLEQGSPEYKQELDNGGAILSTQKLNRLFPQVDPNMVAKRKQNAEANIRVSNAVQKDDFLPKSLKNIEDAAKEGNMTPGEFRGFIKDQKEKDAASTKGITISTIRKLEDKVITTTTTLDQLDSMERKLDKIPGVLTVEGKFSNFLTSWRNKAKLDVGEGKQSTVNDIKKWVNTVTGATKADRKFLMDSAEFIQENELVFNQYRQLITGAQASHKELERLRTTIPNPQDDIDTYRGKLKSMRDGMQRYNKYYKNILNRSSRGEEINPESGEGRKIIGEQFNYAQDFAEKAEELKSTPIWSSLSLTDRAKKVSQSLGYPKGTAERLFSSELFNPFKVELFNPLRIVGDI